MGVRPLLLGWFIALALASGPGEAADPAEIRLVPQPDLGPQLAAFPRLAAPDGPQMQRINQQLDRADGRARKAAQDCRAQIKDSGMAATDADGWHRSITVAMRGPRYLALLASDDLDCGGAHPDTGRFVLAYDLQTGAPLNWQRLLPKSLGATGSLDTAADGTSLGVVASPKLKALYLKTVKPDPECMQTLQEMDLSFILWPDAQQAGIGMEPSDLPHAVTACGDDAVIPLADWRQMGMEPPLLDAIAAAHAGRFYDSEP